jgi:hypothetical protein
MSNNFERAALEKQQGTRQTIIVWRGKLAEREA